MISISLIQVTNQAYVHIFGASLTFILGIVYCWINGYLSKVSIQSGLTSQPKAVLRFILAAMATIFFCSSIFSGDLFCFEFYIFDDYFYMKLVPKLNMLLCNFIFRYIFTL